MTANPTDTPTPHLDLEELIAVANGASVLDRAGKHLAGCERCRREADRWNLVAEGVRELASSASGTAQLDTVPTARPSSGRSNAPGNLLGRRARSALLVTGGAAAAFALLIGAGVSAGVVHVHFALGGTGTRTTLTAVTGCTRLVEAAGTLQQVNGDNLVVRVDGRPVTVTTTASTFVSLSGAMLRDITDGAPVMVRGDRSGGTVRAAYVTVGQPFGVVNPTGFVPIEGTVTDANSAGFTLVTTSRSRIPVTTTSDTLVIVAHARPSQLQVGTPIFALGKAGRDGTLSARAVAAVTQLRSAGHVSVSVKSCSPSSMMEALGALSVAPAPGTE